MDLEEAKALAMEASPSTCEGDIARNYMSCRSIDDLIEELNRAIRDLDSDIDLLEDEVSDMESLHSRLESPSYSLVMASGMAANIRRGEAQIALGNYIGELNGQWDYLEGKKEDIEEAIDKLFQALRGDDEDIEEEELDKDDDDEDD